MIEIKNRSSVASEQLTPRDDFCPLWGRAHSYFDYSYWGHKHPRCPCGHEDKTREVKRDVRSADGEEAQGC